MCVFCLLNFGDADFTSRPAFGDAIIHGDYKQLVKEDWGQLVSWFLGKWWWLVSGSTGGGTSTIKPLKRVQY